MSLKATIEHYLKKNGYLSLFDLENLCKSEQKKLSNGKRRLRELMAVNPQIKPVTNKRGAITAYTWSISAQNGLGQEFCPSCGSWLTHTKTCPTQVTVTNKLF